MEPFKKIKSVAMPLDKVNVDTDQIIPKQFLKLVQKTGFGQYLFYDWRFENGEKPREDFVLNNPKYCDSKILLTRDNFGCGSSREHAAWALLDYGFRVVIAPSFADIFYNNCFKNGILPIKLDSQSVEKLFKNSSEIEVDLQRLEAARLIPLSSLPYSLAGLPRYIRPVGAASIDLGVSPKDKNESK